MFLVTLFPYLAKFKVFLEKGKSLNVLIRPKLSKSVPKDIQICPNFCPL